MENFENFRTRKNISEDGGLAIEINPHSDNYYLFNEKATKSNPL
jgi:hypothetical protein